MISDGRIVWDETGLKDLPVSDEFYFDDEDEMFHMKEYIKPQELIERDGKEDTKILSREEEEDFYKENNISFSGEEKDTQVKGLDV